MTIALRKYLFNIAVKVMDDGDAAGQFTKMPNRYRNFTNFLHFHFTYGECVQELKPPFSTRIAEYRKGAICTPTLSTYQLITDYIVFAFSYMIHSVKIQPTILRTNAPELNTLILKIPVYHNIRFPAYQTRKITEALKYLSIKKLHNT